MPADQMLDPDARLYTYSNYQSVRPLPQWPSLAQWKKERLRIRRRLLQCAGLNAQTAAFKARGRVVKRFEHEGLVVENLCIETLPGLYLTGNLYRPKDPTGPLPLILHPHGHADRARTTPMDLYSLPHRAMNSALLGFAGFAYSMIDHEDDNRQLAHRSLLSGPEKTAANLWGLSMFGLQLNNSIKALDYLLSRPDIDPRRVGCTGESGGGTQTYFLAAVDERVQVAAPAVMLSGHFQGGCVCENAPGLHLKYSNLHYAGLIAPRPLLLLGCSGDWTHHLRQRELPAMRQLYRLYGREEAIDGFYQDEAHNYDRASRERVYAWMTRWLRPDAAPAKKRLPEAKQPVPSRQKLLVFDQAIPPYKKAIRDQPQLFGMWQKLHDKAGTAAEALEALQMDLPTKDDLLVRSQPPRHNYRANRRGLHRINYGRFSQDSSLQCAFVPPATTQDTSILLLRDWDSAEAWRQWTAQPPAALRRAIDQGYGVFVPLLFGQGGSAELEDFRRRADSYLATTYLKTEHMHRLDDIATTVLLAQVEMGLDPTSIALVAEAGTGLLAYAAWAFLHSQAASGPLVADLGGADLQAPATWHERCYVPLLLGSGGAKGLALLGQGGKGSVSGVRAADRRLLPGSLRTAGKKAALAALLGRALKRQ